MGEDIETKDKITGIQGEIKAEDKVLTDEKEEFIGIEDYNFTVDSTMTEDDEMKGGCFCVLDCLKVACTQ